MKNRPVQYQDIEYVLIMRHKRSMVVPRYTPINWWECDVCEITERGFFREFEIKMNRRDFLLDAKKYKTIYEGAHIKAGKENKHDLLDDNSRRGPTEFWYVAPRNVIDLDLIPSWAGFIEVHLDENRPYESVLKRAPRLHHEKADERIKKHMEEVCYWRFHHVLNNQYHRWANKFNPSPPTN